MSPDDAEEAVRVWETAKNDEKASQLFLVVLSTRLIAVAVFCGVGLLLAALFRGAPRRALWPIVFLSGVFLLKNSVIVPMVDFTFNGVDSFKPLPSVSSKAWLLHNSSFVADAHSDTLLWFGRDVLARNKGGHVDVPRLLEGNIALQAFTIVTGTPPNMNFVSNAEPSLVRDQITLKAIFEGWGLKSVYSRADRVLSQIRRLREAEAASDGVLRVITEKRELEAYYQMRMSDAPGARAHTAAYLGIEGLHALDNNLQNVDVFADAGVRMAGLTHFFDNALGGSAHGVQKGGLTGFGEAVIRRMSSRNMAVDVAHASEDLIDSVLNLQPVPRLISSHTGVRGVCDNQRNLADRHVREICRTGGILAVAFFRPAVCGPDELHSIVASMKHIREMNNNSSDCIALGSDWDGFVVTPFDASKVSLVTQALLNDGSFSEPEIRGILGENIRRFLLELLP